MTTSDALIQSENKQSPFTTLIQVFIEPSKAFAAIKERSMIWLPLLLVILGGAIMFVWYYQHVDIAWLQDKLLSAKNLDPAQHEAAAKMMSRNFMMGTSLIGAVLGAPISYAIYALYLIIVSKITRVEIGFSKWFAFSAWSSVPQFLVFPLGFIQILLSSNGQMLPSALNPVSLNQLFFHLEPAMRWATLLDSISILTLWTFVVNVIAFQQWTQKSRLVSIVVIALPSLLFYGAMAGLNLIR